MKKFIISSTDEVKSDKNEIFVAWKPDLVDKK